MDTLKVELGVQSYPIHIGNDLDFGKLIRESIGKKTQLLIVSNTTIAPLYLERVKLSCEAQGFVVNHVLLEDGEEYKNIDSFMAIHTKALEQNLGRDCVFVALGGGVIGDITGFAAASYQRGVDFVQIPTTLLAMVDSSVGGKTAINHPLGKNMIGAFYQPKLVIADLALLHTLEKAELIAGMGEVVKYGFILDKDFSSYLNEHMDAVFKLDNEVLSYVVKRCCALKAYVVQKDEKEQNLRAILNFGHTFAHAIETFLGYGVMLHGQAVGLGMAIASKLCLKRGLINEHDYEFIMHSLKLAQLPTTIPSSMSATDFLGLMQHDKKVQSGKIRYVLLKNIGEAVIASDIDSDEIIELITELKMKA